MNNRKRWSSKEEAEKYAIKALREGNVGLSYCAACDYLGCNPDNKKINNFLNSLYGDWLISMGEDYIKEEIASIKWELDNMEYVEFYKFKPSIENLDIYLQIAKDELKSLKKWRRYYASK